MEPNKWFSVKLRSIVENKDTLPPTKLAKETFALCRALKSKMSIKEITEELGLSYGTARHWVLEKKFIEKKEAYTEEFINDLFIDKNPRKTTQLDHF